MALVLKREKTAAPADPAPTPSHSEILRTFVSKPLLTAAHIGSVGFRDDGEWAQVMAWEAEDLPGEAPVHPSVGFYGDWSKGQLLILDLAKRTVRRVMTTAGQAVPMRNDGAFRRLAWLNKGLLIVGAEREEADTFLHDANRGLDLTFALPGSATASIVGVGPTGVGVLASDGGLWLYDSDSDAIPVNQPRAIPALMSVDWAQVSWSPNGRWLAVLAAAQASKRPGAGPGPLDLDAPHELVLVDTAQMRNQGPLQPQWRFPIPLGMRESQGHLLTRIQWLSDDALLLSGARGIPDSILRVDGGHQTVADLLGLSPSVAGDVETRAYVDKDVRRYQLLVYPGTDDQDRLVYHSENGQTESLGITGRVDFAEDGRLEGMSRNGDGDIQEWSRPVDPAGAQRQVGERPCGQGTAQALAGSTPFDRETAVAPRYVQLRPDGRIALRDIQTCTLSDLVAVEGLDYVQQAQLSPDDRHLIVVGGAGKLDRLEVHVVDLLDMPRAVRAETARAVGTAAVEAPPAAAGGASAAHSPSDKLSGMGVAITLPFDPREWEWEAAAVASEDPWLRSRSVRSCRLRLSDPGIEFGPASARLEIGGALVYVEQSNGFQGHYFVAAAAAKGADAEFDLLIDVRFTPGSWSACDRAVRGLIAGLP